VVTSMTSMAEPPQRETNTSEPTATRPCALLSRRRSGGRRRRRPVRPRRRRHCHRWRTHTGTPGSALTATRPKLVRGSAVEWDGTRTFGTGASASAGLSRVAVAGAEAAPATGCHVATRGDGWAAPAADTAARTTAAAKAANSETWRAAGSEHRELLESGCRPAGTRLDVSAALWVSGRRHRLTMGHGACAVYVRRYRPTHLATQHAATCQAT
jgi:hypothetical protein